MEVFSTEIIVSLLTLTFLEIVLGIDNIVFISIVSDKLPVSQQQRARLIGISLALAGRIILLIAINWIMGLSKPLFNVNDFAISFRDLILIAGGLFLVGKSTSEIHTRLEGKGESAKNSKRLTIRSAIIQILLLDLVFSLDSIITAVGLVDHVWVIVVAIVVSMAIMLLFSKRISDFINHHPAMKILAVAFLIMIGTVLVVEGLHVHVPKGYIYVSMAFALGVEFLNMRIKTRSESKTINVKRNEIRAEENMGR